MNKSGKQRLSIPTVAESLQTAAAVPAVDASVRDAWLRRQEAVVAIGRRAITPSTMSILMQDSSALIAEMLDLECCATAQPGEGDALQMSLSFGHPDTPGVQTVSHEFTRDKDASLIGYALHVAHPIAVADLQDEVRFHDRFLARQGLRGAIAVPLITPNRDYGVLCAGGREIRRFDKEDLLFVETVAQLVTTTFARTYTEQVLEGERDLTTGMLQAMDALVLILDGRGRISHINRACTHATGYSIEDIQARPIWSVFPVPHEAEQFRRAFRELRCGDRFEYESSLLTKHGCRRRVAWSCAIVRKSSGEIESIIVTGIDVTEQREAEELAKQAIEEATAAKTVQEKVLDALTRESIPDSLEEDLPISEEQRAVAIKRLAMLKAAAPKERRIRPRRSYPYHQLIAPIIDGRLPEDDQFTRVSCNDIASGGFSFLASEPPAADMLVVALGSPPNLTHVIAEVVHVTRIKRGNKETYLVGCAYTGRAEYA